MMHHIVFSKRFSCVRGIRTAITRRELSTPTIFLSEKNIRLADGLLRGDMASLAKGITLIESTKEEHRRQAELFTEYVMANSTPPKGFLNSGCSLRLGIAGPPGAGKSTFIENLGMRFINKSLRVAVIPVDPSSHISGGSILGDKTRMDKLSRAEGSYVRASPTRGVLGGIAEHTSDVIGLCEAGAYDVIIVESVGLGQSEVEVDSAVDMLILVIPPGAGDGLQAAKKGIMEAADLFVVNKADGNLLASAKHTKADYSGAVMFIRPKYDDWRPVVMLASAATDFGVDDVENKIVEFHSQMVKNGTIRRKRSEQADHWMWEHMCKQLVSTLEDDSDVQQLSNAIKDDLFSGRTTARAAARKIVSHFMEKRGIVSQRS